MKTTTIRSTVAMMVIFFAVTATSCQKENAITPDTTPPPAATPPAPPSPTVATVSIKPRFITTTQDGSTIRSQVYEYDNQGKLKTYFSKNTSSLDSVTISGNTVIFKIKGTSSTLTQELTLNNDKTFKSFSFSNRRHDFETDGSNLSRILESSNGGAASAVAGFDFINNNLNKMEAEGVVISMNYYSNLSYQPGINEIPVFYKPMQYFKVMEQERATTTNFYSKLIHQVVINFGNRKELHEYVYEFDADRRVTKITDTITNTNATSSSQKVTISTISY